MMHGQPNIKIPIHCFSAVWVHDIHSLSNRPVDIVNETIRFLYRITGDTP